MPRRNIRNPSAYWAKVKSNRRSRFRYDTLTGGTKDVNPQWFKGYITQTGADTCTESNYALPITRLPTANKVTIMEVLKVRASNRTDNAVTFIATATQYISMAFCTRSVGAAATVGADNTATFARLYWEAAGTAEADSAHNAVMEQDLTDGAGHGILVASDKLFVQLDSLATTKTLSMGFELLYRFKTVGMKEYVGIVQSQQ